MASLQVRRVNQEAIERAIQTRYETLPTCTKPTYAAAVAGKSKATSTIQVILLQRNQANVTLQVPTNLHVNQPHGVATETLNTAINDKPNHPEETLDTADKENRWILVTRHKKQDLNKERQPQIKRSRHIELLIK